MPRTIRSRIREANPEAVVPEPIHEPKAQEKVMVVAQKSFFVGNTIVRAGESVQVSPEIRDRLIVKGLI